MTRRLLIAVLIIVIVGDASPAFWVDVHGEVTQLAFVRGAKFGGRPFLPFAVNEISDANRAKDTGDCRFAPREGAVWVKPAMPCDLFTEKLQAKWRSEDAIPEQHFDRELIQEGHEHILRLRQQIINAILRMQYIEARRLLGSALHSLQDFYAHTNWVELGNLLPEPRLADQKGGFTSGYPRVAGPTESTCVTGEPSVLIEDFTGPTGSDPFSAIYPTPQRARLTSGYYPMPPRIAKEPFEAQKCSHGTLVPNDPDSDSYLIGNDRRLVVALRGINKDSPTNRLYPRPTTNPLDPTPWLLGGALNEGARFARAREAAIQHSKEFVEKLLADGQLKDRPEHVFAFMGYTQVVELRGNGSFKAAGYGKQKYHTHLLDLTDWESGELIILVRLGRGTSSGSFNLFNEGAVPAENTNPVGNLANAWDISPGRTVTMRYAFAKPVRVVFTASPNWFSNDPAANDYTFEAYVEKGVRRLSK